MKVVIKTLSQQVFHVEVPEQATVKHVKEAVKQSQNHEISWQTLIYKGRVLPDTEVVHTLKMTSADFMVLMVRKPKNSSDDSKPVAATEPKIRRKYNALHSFF